MSSELGPSPSQAGFEKIIKMMTVKDIAAQKSAVGFVRNLIADEAMARSIVKKDGVLCMIQLCLQEPQGGVPPPYDIMKKMVVPDAFRITRLKPGRRYCVLGRLSDEIGWKHKDAVSMLEDKRREAGKVYYETKKAAIAKKKAALSAASDKPFTQVLAQFGY